MKKMIMVTLLVVVGCSKPKNTQNHSDIKYANIVTTQTPEKEEKTVKPDNNIDYIRSYSNACPYAGGRGGY
jgi:hypothetical protein